MNELDVLELAGYISAGFECRPDEDACAACVIRPCIYEDAAEALAEIVRRVEQR